MTTLSQTDICNTALGLLGCQPLTDITAVDDPAAVDCLAQWQQALSKVSRSHTWNCLMATAVLVPTAQTPIDPATPTPASTPWAPLTAYAANEYVTYGGQLYQALIANTSTASFTNDLTAGFWFETDVLNTNPFGNQQAALYPSGWAYQYPLPADFLLMAALNDNPMAQPQQQFEIIGINLYTNEPQAVIKYVQYQTDTTRYDSLFVGCLALLLASMIATRRRQDDANLSASIYSQYLKSLAQARAKDAGERKPRRFDPVANSRFVGSRYWSTNN